MVRGKVLPICMLGDIETENDALTDVLGLITPTFTLGVLMVMFGSVVVSTAVAGTVALCPLLRFAMIKVAVSPGSSWPLPFPAASLTDIFPIASTGAFIIWLIYAFHVLEALSVIVIVNGTVCWSATLLATV